MKKLAAALALVASCVNAAGEVRAQEIYARALGAGLSEVRARRLARRAYARCVRAFCVG